MNELEQGVYEQAEFIGRLSWKELPQAVKQRGYDGEYVFLEA